MEDDSLNPFPYLGVDNMSYIQLTSPLVLHADPVLPEHAVTKRYVDGKKNAVDASWFTSGVVPVGMMPALTGDVSSVAASGTATLSATGVTAGSYTKVGVSSSGRVVSGSTLAASDIPNVSWSKITTGKPSTAGGYGITNLISLSGGTASGAIVSSATPSNAMHAVTKGYVDNAVVGVVSGSLSVGDVVRKPAITAPTGFLRCNGGEVSKTMYSGLYAVVGDTYSGPLTQPGSGQPWRQQYDINTAQSGDITGWTTGTSLPTSIDRSQSVATKDRVYLLGGQNSYSIHSAAFNADGSLGTWEVAGNLPTNAYTLYAGQAIVTKNRMYLLGCSTSDTYSARNYTALINTDGSLGAWEYTAQNLQNSSQAIVTKNRVYLLGGGDQVGGAHTAIVRTAVINTDGTLGTWVDVTSLPGALSWSQAIVTKNRVYLLGGIGTGNTPSSVVYTAPINADGTLGTWASGAALPATIAYSQSIVTKNRVYLLGGLINGTGSSATYSAPTNTDGTLGNWTTGTSLPGAVYIAQTVVSKNHIHLLGGSNSSAVYTATISGGLNDYSPYYDGTIQPAAITSFKLPDFSAAETSGLNYFIKY